MTEEDILMISEASGIQGVSPLVAHIIRVYQSDYKLVGEERTIAHVFSCGISRHLPREYRRHYLSTGDYGVGKSTVVKRTLKPFTTDVEFYSRLTGPGLDRRTETFDGKILLIEQMLQREPMELSFLMSEGELSVLSAERDEKSGKIVSKTTRLKGEPVVMSTIVGANAGPQYISRTSTGKIDETEQQTRRISESYLRQWKRVDRSDPARQGGVITWIDNRCRELGPSVRAIQAPWADKLEQSIPPVLSMRRGLPKLANLVNVICFLKSALGLRPVVRVKLAEGVFESYLICDPEDLADAVYILGEEDLIESVGYFFARTREVYNFLLSNDGATSKDVAVGLKLSQNRSSEYLRSLKDFGHATRIKVGSEFHYSPVQDSLPELKLGPEFIKQLRAEYTPEVLRGWFQENFPGENARLLLPGTDIASAVVSVSMPSKPTFDTMNRTVPELDTITPIVPFSPPDGYDTTTATDTMGTIEGFPCPRCGIAYPDLSSFDSHLPSCRVHSARTPGPDPDPSRKAEPNPGRLRELKQKVIRVLAEHPDLETFTAPTVWSMIPAEDNVALEHVEVAFEKLAVDGELFQSASGWRKTKK